jgi:endonuclease/exonuclease/phosphatase (EEP) superfamily protein YafD
VRRPHGAARSLLTALGLAGLASVSSGVIARYLPVANRFVLFAAALLPYLTLTGPVSAAALALARRPRLAGGAGIIAAAAVATQATRYRTGPDSPGRELRLMTANLFVGRADCDALVETARQAGVEVLTVQEFTPQAHARLSAAGIDVLFPYRAVDPRPGGSGTGVWSRYPIMATRPISGYLMPLLATKIDVPGADSPPVVVSVHLRNPRRIHGYRHDIGRLPDTLSDMDAWAGDGSVMLAGDFNSTLDMHPFRALLRGGYRDAAEQAGAGMMPTFPGARALFAIDHVLLRRCTAVDAYAVRVPETDHRAVVTTIRLPAAAAPQTVTPR